MSLKTQQYYMSQKKEPCCINCDMAFQLIVK